MYILVYTQYTTYLQIVNKFLNTWQKYRPYEGENMNCRFISGHSDEICLRKRERNSEFCICHLKDKNKDADNFWIEIDRILEDNGTEKFSFPGFFFVPRLGKTTIDFSGFTFLSPADFIDVTFSKDVDFMGATFSKDVDFMGAAFSMDTNFQDAKFLMKSYFGGTTFSRLANFPLATFTEGADFIDAKFTKDANFQNAIFTKDANFQNAGLSKDANFQKARFKKDANFQNARLSKEANFRGVPFSKNANFQEATFSMDAHFPGAKFTLDANFQKTTFSENVHFTESKFSKFADFSNSIFFKKGKFSRAIFSCNVKFKNTLFSSAEFDDANFSSGADFFCTDFLDYASFRNTVFDSPKDVKFHKTNLESASFLYTDLRNLNFLDSDWRLIKGKGLERRAIYDEESCDYPEVEGLYRQLKSNYERDRNYSVANDFYLGEMEMRRLNPNTKKSEKLLLDSYKFLGLYGLSVKIPFIWILCLFFISTGLFYVLGESSNLSGAFKTVLSFAYLQPEFESDPSVIGLLLGMLISVLNVTLIAMTIIALKRKVRR